MLKVKPSLHMQNLQFANAKLAAVLREIDTIRRDDFPQPDSKNALSQIEKYFHELSSRIEAVTETDDESMIAGICSEVIKKIVISLPFLGFIRRSTNVRNAFEFYGPLIL